MYSYIYIYTYITMYWDDIIELSTTKPNVIGVTPTSDGDTSGGASSLWAAPWITMGFHQFAKMDLS